MILKHRFLNAIVSGELGSTTEQGTIVTLKEFKNYFKDIEGQYITSFLPAAVIETGQHSITHTQFLFRIKRGVYRVHPDAIEEHKMLMQNNAFNCREPAAVYRIYI
ncbi:MAG: hypothetical protein OQL06_13515 [Gammaproteobacteria bacterium]|nr:hypothetical protein [Gammaproteobacteria bacterium]